MLPMIQLDYYTKLIKAVKNDRTADEEYRISETFKLM